MNTIYADSFPGTVAAVSDQIGHLLEQFGEDAALPSCRCDLFIVLGEVLNNIVEHAYTDGATGEIDLKINKLGQKLTIETRDTGTPLQAGVLPDGHLPSPVEAVDDLPEGGFGWFLIRSLTDDVEYTHRDGTNHLRFSISV